MHLTFEHVTKFYGPVIGINDVSCRIGPGITGLFGANGAGKSTMMKLASGQLRPTLGAVKIGEHKAWSSTAKRYFGFSPDINNFYEEMTGREFVYAMTRLYGYSIREARRRTADALEEVGMTERAHRRIAGCSHGMRQRIKLAQALVHEPEILLLDEPMNGIDPGGRRDFGILLMKQAEQGRTILLSSHILVEVENLADSILMLARGRVIASGTLAEIRNMMDDQPFTVQIALESPRRLAALLMAEPEVRSAEVHGDAILVRTRNPAQFFARVADLAIEHRLEIRKMQTLDVGADAVFGYLEQGVQ